MAFLNTDSSSSFCAMTHLTESVTDWTSVALQGSRTASVNAATSTFKGSRPKRFQQSLDRLQLHLGDFRPDREQEVVSSWSTDRMKPLKVFPPRLTGRAAITLRPS